MPRTSIFFLSDTRRASSPPATHAATLAPATHTPLTASGRAGSTHDPLPQRHHWRSRTGQHIARRPRLTAASALLAAPSHRCLAGSTHRWPVRVPHPHRASRTRHVAALQAASRRHRRLAARRARTLQRDAVQPAALLAAAPPAASPLLNQALDTSCWNRGSTDDHRTRGTHTRISGDEHMYLGLLFTHLCSAQTERSAYMVVL